MQVLGQGLQDALAPQNDDDTNILKVLQCFFFSNLRLELLAEEVIENVSDVIILI